MQQLLCAVWKVVGAGLSLNLSMAVDFESGFDLRAWRGNRGDCTRGAEGAKVVLKTEDLRVLLLADT